MKPRNGHYYSLDELEQLAEELREQRWERDQRERWLTRLLEAVGPKSKEEKGPSAPPRPSARHRDEVVRML